MRRNVIIAIGLAVLVLASGCAGLVNDDQSGENSVEYPDGYNDTVIENANQSADSHINSLKESGSWTIEYEATMSQAGQNLEISETRHIEMTEDSFREYIQTEGVGPASESYFNGTHQFNQITQNNESMYSMGESTADVNQSMHADLLTTYMDSIKYEQDSVETEGDRTLIIYEGTELIDGSALDSDAESVDNLSSRLAVNKNGHINQFSMNAEVTSQEGSTNNIDFTVTFTDVGSTTVEPPEWLDEARNQSSP